MENKKQLIICILLALLVVFLIPNLIEHADNKVQHDIEVEFNVDFSMAFFYVNKDLDYTPHFNHHDNDSLNLFRLSIIDYKKKENNSQIIVADSNGNPIINEKYNKAVYIAFSPKNNFG